METHFEGSRGSEHMTNPHQRQYDEQNPDNVNHMETDKSEENDKDLASEVLDRPEDIDSDINTDFDDNSGSKESLTNDESSKTDPNQVSDKPTFNRNESL